eukprot:912783_1
MSGSPDLSTSDCIGLWPTATVLNWMSSHSALAPYSGLLSGLDGRGLWLLSDRALRDELQVKDGETRRMILHVIRKMKPPPPISGSNPSTMDLGQPEPSLSESAPSGPRAAPSDCAPVDIVPYDSAPSHS